MRLKYFSYILLIVLIYSCHSKSIIGTYTYRTDFVFHKLKINKDSTFVYLAKGDLSSNTTKGKWQYSNSLLHLNSFDSYQVFEITGKDSISLKNTTISISDIDTHNPVSGYVTFDLDSTKHYFEDDKVIVPNELRNFSRLTVSTFENNTSYLRNANINFINIAYRSFGADSKWSIDDSLTFKMGKLYSEKFPILKKNR